MCRVGTYVVAGGVCYENLLYSVVQPVPLGYGAPECVDSFPKDFGVSLKVASVAACAKCDVGVLVLCALAKCVLYSCVVLVLDCFVWV